MIIKNEWYSSKEGFPNHRCSQKMSNYPPASIASREVANIVPQMSYGYHKYSLVDSQIYF